MMRQMQNPTARVSTFSSLSFASRWGALLGALVVVLGGFSSEAHARRQVFAVHIGVNAAPEGQSLASLRFADDDAARFYEFTSRFADYAAVATVLDLTSVARHPSVASVAKAPTRASLERVFVDVKSRVDAAHSAGDEVSLVFTYSGHGVTESNATALTTLDGMLGPEFLETFVIGTGADRVHLFVDACHGAGVVSPRGKIKSESDGEAINLDAPGAAAPLSSSMLEKYPHVGAVIASPVGQVAHEWSRLEAGVFTHELLSALYGAGDINGDGSVGYSEVASFISAANRAVRDPRARIRALAHPPRIDPNGAIVDVNAIPGVTLVGRTAGHVVIERDDGLRLVDLHPEGNADVRIMLPAKRSFYIRANNKEAKVRGQSGERVLLSSLSWQAPSGEVSSRGSIAEALHEGLFAAPFGRSYYEGYVDSVGLPSVKFEARETAAVPTSGADENAWGSSGTGPIPASRGEESAGFSAWIAPGSLLGAGVVAGIATVGLGLFAAEAYLAATTTTFQRPAAEARDRLYLLEGAAALAGLTAITATAVGVVLLPIFAE